MVFKLLHTKILLQELRLLHLGKNTWDQSNTNFGGKVSIQVNVDYNPK